MNSHDRHAFDAKSFAQPRNSWSHGFLLKWLYFDYDNSPNNHNCEHSFTLLIALTWFQSLNGEKPLHAYILHILDAVPHKYSQTILISNRFTSHKVSNKLLSHDISQPSTYERYFGAMWMECVRRVFSVHVWPKPFICSDTLCKTRGSPCPYPWPPPFPLLDNTDGVLKAQKPSGSHDSCSPHSPLKIQASSLLKGLFCQGACSSKGPHWKHIFRLAKD